MRKPIYKVIITLSFLLGALVWFAGNAMGGDNSSSKLTDISIMAAAPASDPYANCRLHIEGYVCYPFDNGERHCLHGGEWGVFCDDNLPPSDIDEMP